MDYNNKIIINNNLIDYSKESNKFIPYENISNYILSQYNNKNIKTQSLKRNINKNNCYNNNDRNLINTKKPFSNRDNIKMKNDIYSLQNLELKRKNKTPQTRMNIRDKFYYNENMYKKRNIQSNNNYIDFNDFRVDYCLEMLNLNDIKKIFHERNIKFNEMLYLSQKDMKKIGIPTYSQLIIQKFTKDYLAKASYYTAEELEKFFKLYYNHNIKALASNEKKQKELPIRSFSPIAYNTKRILNNYDYELLNINSLQKNSDNQVYRNHYNKINNKINSKINNNNFYTNINQRNCFSASQRRKNQLNKRKENKNIRFSNNSNLYPNNKRFRNISSSNSQIFVNSSPINGHNYLIDDFQEIENKNITNLSNFHKRKFSNNINNKISKATKKIEKYFNNIKQPKKREGNFEALNLAINNFYKENMKKEKAKNNIKKMNQNNPNRNILSKNIENHEIQKKHFNSFENIINSKDNYFQKMNNINIKNQSQQAVTSKSNHLYNSYDIYPNNKNTLIKQQYKNSKIKYYNDFINNKNNVGNNNSNNERKTINTSIIYKPNNENQYLISNSINSNEYIPFSENSKNIIKYGNKIKKINKSNKNSINKNINNQNLIINERNNYNIYYNTSKLINNDIFNYEPYLSSKYYAKNQFLSTPDKVVNNINNARNNKTRKINMNMNINKINNSQKKQKIPLTDNNIKTINITKNLNQTNSLNNRNNNSNINNNYRSATVRKNNFNKKTKKNKLIDNKYNDYNNLYINKRSISQLNDNNNRINRDNNNIYSISDNININKNNISNDRNYNQFNNLNGIKNDILIKKGNLYLNNKKETEDSDYYINYL